MTSQSTTPIFIKSRDHETYCLLAGDEGMEELIKDYIKPTIGVPSALALVSTDNQYQNLRQRAS